MAGRSSKTGSESENSSETSTDDVSDAKTPEDGGSATEDLTAQDEAAEDETGREPDPEGTDTSDAEVEDAEVVSEEVVSEEVVSEDAEPQPENIDDVSDTVSDIEAANEAEQSDTETVKASPEPKTIVRERGPGFVPLVLGGIVAVGLGYLGSVSGILPGSAPQGPSPELEAQLNQQAETLAALQEQIEALATADAPTVDLSVIDESLDALSAQMDQTAGAIGGLAERVVTLEERPVFSGDITGDNAEAAEAIAALEDQMRAREDAAAAREAEAEEMARAAEEAAAAAQAEAEAAMAEAEAAALAATQAAEANAALDALRLAITRGEAFAEPLAAVSAVTQVPDALSESAEAGVPSLETLQDSFAAAARAALPAALREVAGDRPMDRIAAFVQGQVGGRAIEPREGDSPDAILSRAQGHVTAGDLAAALSEISALPEGAQATMGDWIAEAQARADVMAALDTVTQSLSGGN